MLRRFREDAAGVGEEILFPELFRNPQVEVVRLPSTSPAAALYSFETKREAFRRFFAGGDAAR